MHPRTPLLMGLALSLGILLSLVGVQRAFASDHIIHVKPEATGSGDGSSWANATTLQGALGVSTPGDEIWVATGIYTPGLSASHTFTLSPGVGVYGGFAATETVRSARDWVANPTILSGDIGGDDGTDATGVVTNTDNIEGNNSYHVVFADGTSTPMTATTVLDGFTITAGKATGDNFPDDAGGGFYCTSDGAGSDCSPHLSNLIFSGNMAFHGGAMYNRSLSFGASNSSLVNVTFQGNTAYSSGGGIYNFATSSGASSPSLVNVTFQGNGAYSNGGGIVNFATNSGASSPSLVNVTFQGNSADSLGGGIHNRTDSSGASSPAW